MFHIGISISLTSYALEHLYEDNCRVSRVGCTSTCDPKDASFESQGQWILYSKNVYAH